MAIRYDHVQYGKTPQQILSGVDADSILFPAAIYTNQEAFRVYINPGFNGTIEWILLQLTLLVTGTGTANAWTGKWQMRARGETAWTDIATCPALALTASPQSSSNIVTYDAAADTNTSPWELRAIFSTTASTTVTFTISQTYCETRTVGESV